MKKSFNKNRADQILNSFEGIQPSEVPPFFYTRLKARMERELTENAPPAFFLRPAFLTISLSLVLILNIIFLTKPGNENIPSSGKSNTAAGIQSFADAYNLNTSSVY